MKATTPIRRFLKLRETSVEEMLFRGLTAAERHHADLWSKRLQEHDG